MGRANRYRLSYHKASFRYQVTNSQLTVLGAVHGENNSISLLIANKDSMRLNNDIQFEDLSTTPETRPMRYRRVEVQEKQVSHYPGIQTVTKITVNLAHASEYKHG